jgi:hypothetical protein
MGFGELERCKVICSYAKALGLNKKSKEAQKIMQKAIMEYSDTP